GLRAFHRLALCQSSDDVDPHLKHASWSGLRPFPLPGEPDIDASLGKPNLTSNDTQHAIRLLVHDQRLTRDIAAAIEHFTPEGFADHDRWRSVRTGVALLEEAAVSWLASDEIEKCAAHFSSCALLGAFRSGDGLAHDAVRHDGV